MQAVLRYWLLGTLVFVTGAGIWSFAPVLVPVIGLTIIMAGLVAVIVAAARWIERLRGGPPGPDQSSA